MKVAILILALLLFASPVFAADADEPLCLRCERFAGGGGGGGSDVGSPPLSATGCYTGNGVDLREIPVGFTPDFVFLQEYDESNTNVSIWRTSTMSGDFSCREGGDAVCAVNQIMGFTSSGFEIGTAAAVNALSQPYCYLALQAKPDFLEIGSYLGATVAMTIPTSFLPDVVIDGGAFVTNEGWGFRTDTMADGAAANWKSTETGSYKATLITAFTDAAPPLTLTPSFSLAAGEMTAAGTYHWLAFNDQPSRNWISRGTYTGTGSGDQVITTTCTGGLEFVMIATDADNVGSHADVFMIRALTAGITGSGRVALRAEGAPAYETNDGIAYLSTSSNSFTVSGDTNAAHLHNWFAICAGNNPATDPVANWTSSFIAVWNMEEATDATRVNATGATCGSSCNLARVTTADLNTTEFRQGAGSADADGATAADALGCNFASCGAALNVATSASWGCYGRLTTDATASAMQFAGTLASGNLSYAMIRDTTNNTLECRVIEGGGTDRVLHSANNAFPINTWVHGTCTFNDTTNVLSDYVNADTTPTTGTCNTMKSVAAGTMNILANTDSGSTPTVWTGQVDECFVKAGVLAVDDICRICSCGIDGALCTQLEADPTLYGSKGLNSSLCGSCTLPVANKVAPT